MSVFLLILVGQAYSPILLFSGESGFLYAKLPVRELNSILEFLLTIGYNALYD